MSAPAETAGAADSSTLRTARHDRLRLLLRSVTFLAGMAIVLFWVGCALFGARLVPYDPYSGDLLNTLGPPTADNWFGTDQLGRDVFSRVIVGARDILTVAPLATLLGTLLGTALGLMAGYFRGVIDDVLSRIIDAVNALPLIIIALLALVALGTSNTTVVIVIGVIFAPIIARTVRAAVLSERELDYVGAARLRGENAFYIMFIEILPNIVPPILVETTVRLGYAIFTVATLAFLGFGVNVSTPNWGSDINANYGLIGAGYWWATLFPALAIASLVVAINLVADSIEQVLAG
jgi:peptide/nickel transport system permease protein